MIKTEMSEADQETAFNELVNGQTDTPNAENGNAEQTSEPALTSDTKQVLSQDAEQGQSSGEVDIWANATPEQKAALEELHRKTVQAENNVRAQAGRMSALQRQINEMQQVGAKAPEATEEDILSEEEEELEEVASIARKIAKQEAAKVRDETAAQLEPFKAEQEQSFVQSQLNMLSDAHPDYAEINGSPEFQAWISENSHNANLMGMYSSQYAEDNITLLNAFKFSRSQFTSPSDTNSQSEPDFDPVDEMVTPETSGITSGGSAFDTDDEEALFNMLVAEGNG